MNKQDQIVFIVAGALCAIGFLFGAAQAYFQYTLNGDIGYAIIISVCIVIGGIAFYSLKKTYRSSHE